MTELVLIFIKVVFTHGHPNQNCVMQKVRGIYSQLQQLNSLVSVSQSYTSLIRIRQKTIFYEHLKQFAFPEIDAAWRKNQVQQIEEIKKFGRVLELAVDGQCDSPGHSATYNTVSAIDAETNKVINFRVVHVKV